MDQKKQGQQSEGFEGQQQPPQTQNPNREPAEGPRDTPSREKGQEKSGGITNRDLDSEMDEQDELPDRGTSGDESDDSER